MITLLYPLFWQNSMTIVEYNEYNTFEEESGQREKNKSPPSRNDLFTFKQYSNSISQN